ncbi:MAG: hypothetical protein NC485_08445 [Ruminococcus flavefaciens]|nr:hypothetical protein [Ruminococcus flavefaciens]
MSEFINLFLCGGVFCFLLDEMKPMRNSARKHLAGSCDKHSAIDVMQDLLFAIKGTESISAAKDISLYKECKSKGSVNVPFNEAPFCDSFDNAVRNDFHNVLKRITDFTDKRIDLAKKEWLVQVFLYIIFHDDEILETDIFYIGNDGTPKTKEEMRKISHFYFQPFLIGVLHYILKNRREDNCNGIGTLDFLGEKTGNKRRFKSTLNIQLDKKITVSIIEFHFNNKNGNSIIETVIDKSTKSNKSSNHKLRKLPTIPIPDEISEYEHRYIEAMLQAFAQKINVPELTIDELKTNPFYNNKFIRERRYYFETEALHRGTRDIYDDTEDEYFNIFLSEIYDWIIDTYEEIYPTGYERLMSVLDKAMQARTDKFIVSHETAWIGNGERRGACHFLINLQILDGWVKNSAENI